jgi:hypothetical protein
VKIELSALEARHPAALAGAPAALRAATIERATCPAISRVLSLVSSARMRSTRDTVNRSLWMEMRVCATISFALNRWRM